MLPIASASYEVVHSPLKLLLLEYKSVVQYVLIICIKSQLEKTN